MAAGATVVPSSLLQSVVQLEVKQKLALMVGVAAAIALAVGGWMWSQVPDYKVLFSNLADRDGGAIIAALTQMNVPYKFTEGGGAILVPSNQVHDARLKLASQGLPRGGTIGFELVDNQKFGATQFQEQVNYQRGLEGELSKSIQSVSAVQAARVHLAIPKPTVFLREQQGPSASVLLTLYPGKTLDRAQVTGMLHLIASSVPDLTVANVSIIDQNGNLLSRNGAGIDSGGLDPSQLSYINQIEKNTIQRIVDIIEPMVGRSNTRVQVTADVDFSRIESMEEKFKPNQDQKEASIRNQQTRESMNGGTGPQGVPGALSNQPPGNAVALIDGKSAPVPSTASNAGGTTSTSKDASTYYEVDKSIQHVRNPVGGIKRMTAAVIVNYRKKVDEKGQSTMTALSAQEMEQINNLVREAMGFNKERGDSLNIVNATFDEPTREAIPELPLWKQPDNISLAKDIGRYVLLAALAGFLFFGLLRPMLRQAMQPRVVPELDGLPPPTEAELLEYANAKRGDTLQLARKMAREDPKIVANVVKTWVNADE